MDIWQWSNADFRIRIRHLQQQPPRHLRHRLIPRSVHGTEGRLAAAYLQILRAIRQPHPPLGSHLLQTAARHDRR